MHKKLENDLMSLAHSILQMKNKEDVFALKEKSQEIYEKLSLLAFVEEYVNTTPNLNKTKEELVAEVEQAIENKELELSKVEEEKVVHQLEEEVVEDLKEEDVAFVTQEVLEEKEEKIEQPFDELESIVFGNREIENHFKNDVKDVGDRKTPTLEEELEDTIPVDVMATLFDEVKPKSLNDKLQTNIQIGLNDRIAFVKNLFDGSQEDFNRVVSQLNTFKTEKEAKKFINKMVKPDYNWSEQEELETRFMDIVSRKFA